MAEHIERAAAVDAVSEVYYETPDVNLSAEKFEAAINAVPAADVAPVVHGWWGDDGSGIIICSECGRGYSLIPRYTHYCPNCGAKMD